MVTTVRCRLAGRISTVTEIGDIERFSSARKLWLHPGRPRVASKTIRR
jgi:hypothetical protein